MTTDTPTTPAIARLAMVTIDCAAPGELAAFYARVLGWEVSHSEEEYAMITSPAADTAVGFGRVEDHTPPPWPDATGSKQFHLDLSADDLPAAEAACRELGATVPDFQPGADRWRVLLDPAGHPFCISTWSADA